MLGLQHLCKSFQRWGAIKIFNSVFFCFKRVTLTCLFAGGKKWCLFPPRYHSSGVVADSVLWHYHTCVSVFHTMFIQIDSKYCHHLYVCKCEQFRTRTLRVSHFFVNLHKYSWTSIIWTNWDQSNAEIINLSLTSYFLI